ncbi:early nodulin-like protein 1 [Salvia divinorum]|uniref:Early nodulin-like protein 1 n=1 Tax=Salvia divinorum TaxID=28513 RepID=A0ABD1HKJ9_SALDI
MVVCASTLMLLLVFLFGFIVTSSLAHNHVYHVGEHDGWTLLPSGEYNNWAQRHRFQVNDDLVFKYQKGNDSVLVVGEDDYNKCNKKNPIHTLTDGYSKVKLKQAGPFFFISGHGQRCEKGQKLTTVVLSDHQPRHSASSAAPSPSPSAKTPSHAPPLHSPSHSPSPAAHESSLPPSHSPSSSPSAITPPHAPPPSNSPSPSPTARTPSHAPPLQPPSHSPSPAANKPAPLLSHSPSPSPSATTPTHAPPPSHSPSPSPTHAPPTKPLAPAPASHQSPPPGAEAPKNGDYGVRQPAADQPISLPPHHAPAPAPSSAPFVLTSGLSVVAAIVSALIVV